MAATSAAMTAPAQISANNRLCDKSHFVRHKRNARGESLNFSNALKSVRRVARPTLDATQRFASPTLARSPASCGNMEPQSRGVRDPLGLPERPRMRDALRVTGQRRVRIAQEKQSAAAVHEAALPGVVAPKNQRLTSMAVDLVERERAVYVATTRLQITAVYTRRPQRMARLHLVIGVAVRPHSPGTPVRSAPAPALAATPRYPRRFPASRHIGQAEAIRTTIRAPSFRISMIGTVAHGVTREHPRRAPKGQGGPR